MQKPVAADEEHGERHEESRCRAGEAQVEAVLRGVHAGDDAELGGREARDAEVDVHLAPGDQEVVHPADVLAHPEAGRPS